MKKNESLNHHDECHHDHDCCCHELSFEKENEENIQSEKRQRIILLIRVAISILFLVLALVIKNDITNIVFLIISYLFISYDVLWKTLKHIRHGEIFDEHFLMSLASLTALIVYFVNKDSGIDGYDGVLVMLLYQIGEFLQDLAVDKSKDSIVDMMKLDVDEVTKVIDGETQNINAKYVEVDDVLLIKPGDVIPVDGIIIKGSSSLNMASLTGESAPVAVNIDDKVLSGSLNIDGSLYIKATSTFTNSTSAKVLDLISKANENKATKEKFITKFAKIYTPIVILISLIVMFIVPLCLGFKENFFDYLYKGLTIMVISCPCALVISIPLSYFMAIGKCAKNAILVKGAIYFEEIAKTKIVAFDKTGTLTKGTFEVKKIVSNNKELMSALIYSCEKNFSHPIALSINKYFENKVKEIEVNDLTNIPGYGLKATYQNKTILIGNEKLLKQENISVNNDEIGTLVYVIYDHELLGYVVIDDVIKEEAIDSLNKLENKYQLVLISGDNKKIVETVANKLNIKTYYASMLPENKVETIEKLGQNSHLIYVGDGINDAACLVKANVGIAMKSLGSDIAIEASDVVIMDDKISSVNKLLKTSKKTMKIVYENIILSIVTKFLVMILAIFIKIPMFVAIIADVGVCLLAIANSLRIMYGKIKL